MEGQHSGYHSVCRVSKIPSPGSSRMWSFHDGSQNKYLHLFLFGVTFPDGFRELVELQCALVKQVSSHHAKRMALPSTNWELLATSSSLALHQWVVFNIYRQIPLVNHSFLIESNILDFNTNANHFQTHPHPLFIASTWRTRNFSWFDRDICF